MRVIGWVRKQERAIMSCERSNCWLRAGLVALFGLLLAGCVGLVQIDEADQAQLQSEAMLPDAAISDQVCPAVLQGLVSARKRPPISERKVCGHPAPFEVDAIGGSYRVALSPEATVNCVIASQLQRFFASEVQPLALQYFGQPVTSVQVAASYVCRTRNHKKGAKLSEHGRANAIDISFLTLADGTRLSIADDWHSVGRKGRFLRAFNRRACAYFTTVIGPGGDSYHQSHIHLDHARHGRNGTWRVCQ